MNMHFNVKTLQATIFTVAASSLLTSVAIAQSAAVKGFVYDKQNGEPIGFMNVRVKDKTTGATTDLNGYFSIKLEPGDYTLVVGGLGYEKQELDISLLENQVFSKKFFLIKRTRELKSLEVTSRKEERREEVQVGTLKITPKEMKQLPSAGGEPDIAQFLQVTPGVTFTGDQGGQLYIRGGSPVQNKILLDGMTIYNPFHSIGLYSVFETDAIRNVEVITGGFNAEYGDRTSAIVAVTTKDGNKNRLSGKLSASPIMARVMLEGPLVKAKEEGGSSTTFLISAKHSYLEQTSKSLYSWLPNDQIKQYGLPYNFTDLYGKITVNGSNGSKLNVFGFNFNDLARFNNNLSEAKWNSYGGGTNFVVNPGNSSVLITGGFSYSNYDISLTEPTAKPRNSTIGGFEGNLDFTYFLPNFSEVKYGVEVSGFQTNYQYYNNIGISSNERQYTTEIAAYLRWKKNIGEKVIIEPSLRLQYYASLPAFSPEPRLAAKWNVAKNFRLKAATGLYSQNLISTKSDRDVVNFFTGFLAGPDEDLVNTKGQVAKSNIQTAFHLIGGAEFEIRNVDFNVEPWFKDFTQMININRNKMFASDPDFMIETGKAYGIDLSARYSVKRLYLWAVYSYGKNSRYYRDTDGNLVKYPPPFDRTHNINIVASYTYGRKLDWEFGVRFNYGSGFPFTQTQGFYEQMSFNPNGIGTSINQQNGQLGLAYASSMNGGRLPDYSRLDISVKKSFVLSNTSTLDATASVTNVYNRQNLFYIDRVTNTKAYQLPVFPSVNLTWNF